MFNYSIVTLLSGVRDTTQGTLISMHLRILTCIQNGIQLASIFGSDFNQRENEPLGVFRDRAYRHESVCLLHVAADAM
jgi:hypothetical protein